MAGETAKISWLSVAVAGLGAVVAIETSMLGVAAWYGSLNEKVLTLAAGLNLSQEDRASLHASDLKVRDDLARAVDERNHLINDLERRITDRSDAVNEKIASATATNQATRDMLMLIERRIEVLEAERRSK
jgi:chromosome segregation ATPase